MALYNVPRADWTRDDYAVFANRGDSASRLPVFHCAADAGRGEAHGYADGWTHCGRRAGDVKGLVGRATFAILRELDGYDGGIRVPRHCRTCLRRLERWERTAGFIMSLWDMAKADAAELVAESKAWEKANDGAPGA